VLATLLASVLPTMALVAERAPARQISVGFFDAWGYSRKCAAMSAKQVDHSRYTHLIWSFLYVEKDLSLSLVDENQWNDFLAIPNVKKIVSFGGDDNGQLIKAALNKDLNGMADKVIDFFNKHKGVDGLDIDWEFPDVPEDNKNYIEFLRVLRSKLPGKSISIDLPMNDSLLKYPLKEMGDIVDWFNVMTYGYYSWKYGPDGSNGCPGLDCLRSHMDIRRVSQTWSYLTKDSGMPANKFVLGVANYGNGFVLENAQCIDPNDPACTYKWKQAPSPSECMHDEKSRGNVANWEIRNIVKANKPGTQNTYDVNSDSNILVYNNPEAVWVGYLDDNTMARRKEKYVSWGAAGTAEWTLTMR
jgi:GH18 family chitinase